MKVHQTFRIDPELLEKVEKQAKKENRKVGNLYETAVARYIMSAESFDVIKNARTKKK